MTLCRRIIFTTRFLDGSQARRHIVKAAPYTMLNEKNVDDLLLQEATKIEQIFPKHKFRLVPLKPQSNCLYFNFVETEKEDDS